MRSMNDVKSNDTSIFLDVWSSLIFQATDRHFWNSSSGANSHFLQRKISNNYFIHWILHSVPENLKKSRPKKLVKSNKSISRNFILTKFHFLQFQKWPKINFWTGKKFKTAENAISRKKFFDFFDFSSLFCLDFFKFSGPLWSKICKIEHCALLGWWFVSQTCNEINWEIVSNVDQCQLAW